MSHLSTAARGAIVEEIWGAPAPEILARALRSQRGFFYLDSAKPEEITGRAFSLIGFEPFLIWQNWGEQIEIDSAAGHERVCGEPLAHLRKLMSRYSSPADIELPFPGGAVGYFGYEFGARSAGVLPSAPNRFSLPDARFAFYDGLLVFDLAAGRTYAVANPVAGRTADQILIDLRAAVRSALDDPRGGGASVFAEISGAAIASNLTRADYLERVGRAKEYIAAGDIYQVNLAQRFEVATREDPFAIYERLRRLNPAPYGAYLNLGESQILSSSPELLARIDRHGRVLTRPIKGTRPRGRGAAEDRQLAAELETSEKDHAELLMIVDLLRNDLGRVCRFGSVKVDERHRLEAHPTVFHLVATISGDLIAGRDIFDCLRSMLPGGSITGAPKIRAMQIIDELEPDRRQVYTGSIGFLGFDGTCDLNIAIRTILCRPGTASFQVGGGIVADSDPESEYEETLAKGRALRAALLGQTTL